MRINYYHSFPSATYMFRTSFSLVESARKPLVSMEGSQASRPNNITCHELYSYCSILPGDPFSSA